MINRLSDAWTPQGNRPATVACLEPPATRAREPKMRPARQWATTVEQTMGRYPLVTMLAGLTLGVLLGWYIKR